MQKFLGAALAAALLVFSGAASAEDCPRSFLDKQYCDRDGDLTADLPTDKSKIADPGTIIFAYTPVEDPAVYAKVWDGFINHMSEKTGKKVVFFPVQSNAAQIEAMIRQTGGETLTDVRLFDIYRSEQIGAGKKSLAYSLTYQDPERTLTDKDAAKLRNKIVKRLERELGAQLRG